MKGKGKFIPNKKNKILTLAGILLSCFGTVKAKPESGRDGHLLEQIRSVSRQKGELQQQEVELRARMLAMEIQRSFESRSAQYENVAARLQAWANESLLREQNKEVATLRSERDHFEAERSQNIHKISELEEYFQEKERQYAAFHEQDRIAQETSKYKDEQLREAQGWMARAQEMDAFQSSTNHSLQAELRERTEQYNQLWHGCQRQKRDVDLLRHGVPSSGSDEPSALICHASTRDYSGGFTSSCTVSVTAAKGVKTKNPSFVGRMLQSPAQTSNGAQYGSSTPSSSVNEQVGDVLVNNLMELVQNDTILEMIVHETLVSSGKDERNLESALLDERSLLACIVRTIPAGERVRISSTVRVETNHNESEFGSGLFLINTPACKMLAPLQWHDYRKKYGEVEDFVASHLEKGTYIQVREGAQKMVAASVSAATYKVAAAAALSSPNSMYVAMTPMAQSQGLKKNDKTVQRGRQSCDYMAPQQRNH
ncbi:uncharacterized protein LOC125592669 [Brassica napus]|uniref:uncharacterized protein LOC125592669 n=1 Tax=Brassica napus TaxID=3708 RepID=UPI00207A865F|nr:uncharacterized protein LOC125592669 [Brassica napus]